MNWQPMLGYFEGGRDLGDPLLYESAMQPPGRASALPALAYRSKAFADLEDEKVWTRAWSCIGYSSRIPRAGDLYPFTVGQHGVHVQRQADGSLKAHFNFAQHGGCRFVPRQCQTGRKTNCFYTSCGHSRDRDVIPANPDGSEPSEMYMYLGVNPLKLIPVRVAELGALMFVNLDFAGPALEMQLGAAYGTLSRLFSEPTHHRVRRQTELPCNWKLAGKLFLESNDAAPGTTREWFYPNLLVARGDGCVTTGILQPTSMNSTLVVTDVFETGRPRLDDAALDFHTACFERGMDQARTLQRALAGGDDPSPFLPQAGGDRPLADEPNTLVQAFNARLVRQLLVRHTYVERPLYTNPGRSLNAGVNSGAF